MANQEIITKQPGKRSATGNSDFLRLWTGQTISLLGSAFTSLALPIIAVIVLKATPFQMGLLIAIQTLPQLLFGLFAGVLIDRYPRRSVLIIGDLGRALVLLSIPLSAFIGALSLIQLYAVGFVTGTLTVFFDVAYQSYLPSLVIRSKLVEGNSRLETTRSMVNVSAPGVAGAVVQILWAPFAIFIDSASFLISGAFLVSIKTKEQQATKMRPPVLQSIKEGLTFVAKNRFLLPIATFSGFFNFFGSGIAALFILFAIRELGMDPIALGMIAAAGGVGTLLGASLANRISRKSGVGPTIIGGALLGGAALQLIAFASSSMAIFVLVACQVVSGFGLMVFNISQVSLRQAITEDHMLGRMTATMRFIILGMFPIGALFAGYLGGLIGLRLTIAVLGAGCLASTLWLWTPSLRRMIKIPEQERPVPEGSKNATKEALVRSKV